jgi:3-hydroxybutyryl-CoA dehydrogenase
MTPVETVGVVGAGFMGSGIAESVARAGTSVVVHEPEQERLDLSRERVSESVAKGVEKGKLSDEEDLDAKAELFGRLDEVASDAVVVASNTSSIPIAELASATTRPERVLGLHFFSPVPVMPLVEVVIGLESSDDTIAQAEAFVDGLGKTAIRTKDRSGFVVNMLLVPYLMAAVRMYEDGFASREDIDQGMKLGCGHPMGPLELCDFVGLDVLYSVCESLYEEFKQPEYAPPPLMKRMVAAGRLGRKAGRGFYEY